MFTTDWSWCQTNETFRYSGLTTTSDVPLTNGWQADSYFNANPTHVFQTTPIQDEIFALDAPGVIVGAPPYYVERRTILKPISQEAPWPPMTISGMTMSKRIIQAALRYR